jgi:hypothetical protein
VRIPRSVVFMVMFVVWLSQEPCFSQEVVANNTIAEPETFSEIIKIATDCVDSDPAILGRPRIVISGVTLTYDFAGEGPTQTAHNEWFTPLEVMIRQIALRRDIINIVGNLPQWAAGPLNTTFDAVRNSVLVISETHDQGRKDEAAADLAVKANINFNELGRGIVQYAKEHRLHILASKAGAAPYRVTVAISPENGVVNYMQYLDYRKCTELDHGASCGHYWNQLFPGDNFLIGRYHYKSTWSVASGGGDEGNFIVDAPSRIRFTPHPR